MQSCYLSNTSFSSQSGSLLPYLYVLLTQLNLSIIYFLPLEFMREQVIGEFGDEVIAPGTALYYFMIVIQIGGLAEA